MGFSSFWHEMIWTTRNSFLRPVVSSQEFRGRGDARDARVVITGRSGIGYVVRENRRRRLIGVHEQSRDNVGGERNYD
ncbi:hypothetical protein ASE23_26920 [Rhizobium sp. Root73]|nr:hypothetical protein ASE23_26920 [Rhizobium sp. Root73]